MDARRILWIDYVKGITIILMVLAHLPLSNICYNDYIYCFHMPVFFLVSGFFADNSCQSLGNLLWKNLKQLIIPYVLFYLLTIPLGILTVYIHPSLFGNPSFIDLLWKPFVGLLLGEYVSFTRYSICTNGPLWFLVALFWVRCFSYLYSRRGVSRGIFVSILLSFFLCSIQKIIHGFNLYFSLDSAIYACPFYLIGNIMYKNKLQDRISKIPRITIFLISVFFFIAVWFLYKINGRIDISSMCIGNSFVLSYLNAILGSIALILLCMLIPPCPVLAKIGQGTLVILSFNGLTLYCIRFIFNKFFEVSYDDYSLPLGFVITVFASVSVLPVYSFAKNKFPILLGR